MNAKERLLKATQRRYTNVFVEALDSEFRIQSLTAKELNEYVQWANNSSSDVQSIIRLVSLVLVDEKGDRLFSDEELPVLEQLELAPLIVLANAAQTHSGLDKEAQQELRGN